MDEKRGSMSYFQLILNMLAIIVSIILGIDSFLMGRRQLNRLLKLIGYAFFAAGFVFTINFLFKWLIPLEIFEEFDFPILFYLIIVISLLSFGFKPTWKAPLQKPEGEEGELLTGKTSRSL